MDYDAGLDRAYEDMPEITAGEDRFQVPEPELRTEGKTTVLMNFPDIVDTLNRDQDHLMKYLLREIGTAGHLDENDRARLKGDFGEDQVRTVIDAYVGEYVLCSECGRPDTHLEKEGQTRMLQCDACGAFRPVGKNPGQTQTTKKAVEEGETYELKITAIGNKGDGIAKKGEYTIFVPGAQEGDVVNARIDNVSGNLAFAERVQ